AVPGDPVCPRHLDGIARAEWRKMVALLSELGVLSKTDGSALAIYCSAHSQWRRAEEQMRAKGMIIDTARGGAMTSPYYRIARDAQALCLKMLIEIGMTPMSRTRIKANPEQVADDLGRFLESAAPRERLDGAADRGNDLDAFRAPQ